MVPSVTVVAGISAKPHPMRPRASAHTSRSAPSSHRTSHAAALDDEDAAVDPFTGPFAGRR
jgi:hypothetical protein